jgi:hypothetical protein
MNYPGGKNGAGTFQRIICQIPPHGVYVEGFLGSGAIMRLKRPAVSSIGIDADREVLLSAQLWAGTVPGLQLRHADAIRWLSSHTLTPDTFVYLDPPYLINTRRSKRLIYQYELQDADHARLLAVIVKLNCMVAISGYWSEMYAAALQDWRTISFSAQTRGGTPAREWLWMNYPEPVELHDYSHLGQGFRERERIKRKKARWTRRLREMPTLERHALMAAIDEMRTAHAPTPQPAGALELASLAAAMQPAAAEPEPPRMLGRPTPEIAMQPELVTPDPARVHDIASLDLPPTWRPSPAETTLPTSATPAEAMPSKDRTPPEMALLDQAEPPQTTMPDPSAENGDGRRQPTPPEAMHPDGETEP